MADEMCTSWWPTSGEECTSPPVEDRAGERLCQEHVDVDDARGRLGMGPLTS